jgi:hypothetical protein
MGASSYGDDATIGGGDITVAAANDAASTLVLSADNSDDAGDDWQLSATAAQTLTVGSDKAMAGTFVPQLTLTPHATPTSSIAAVTGNFTTGGDLTVGDDLLLSSDSAVIKLGASSDITITHVADYGITIEQDTDATAEPVLTLKNTGDLASGPIMHFIADNGAGEADDDVLGVIKFSGDDSGDAETIFAQMSVLSSDVTNADEAGKFKFEVMAGGTAGTAGMTEVFSIGGEDQANSTECEVVINEGSIDCNFRAESDGNTHMLFVDAGNDRVGVGTSTPYTALSVVNDYHTTTFESQISDGQGGGEILKYSPGADDTLTVGQLYYLNSDGTWDQTDADAVATGASQLLGIGLGSARTVGVLLRGFVRIPSTEILNLPGSGACDGLPVYVSTTAGHLDFTAPSGNNDFVRVVGYAIDDDSSDVLVYFNPDPTWVVVSA